jgi:hypothetical protein
LLNFHLPHFLLERASPGGDAAYLEAAFLANLVGALTAAVAIWGNRRWGWLLGVLVAGLSFVLYLAQQTVGLPGLPRNWWEPSRIVALIIEVLFVVLARNQLSSSHQRVTA